MKWTEVMRRSDNVDFVKFWQKSLLGWILIEFNIIYAIIHQNMSICIGTSQWIMAAPCMEPSAADKIALDGLQCKEIQQCDALCTLKAVSQQYNCCAWTTGTQYLKALYLDGNSKTVQFAMFLFSLKHHILGLSKCITSEVSSCFNILSIS